jgi:N utilization substance protein B
MDHLVTIDPLLESTATNWRLDRMALIDRLIMRMATYELIYTDTPKAVIIDEALELAKTFSGDEAVAFINGILDGVCQRLEHEAASAKQQPAEG